MTYWFTEHNWATLAQHGIDGDFVWGEIIAVHSIGNYVIVEFTKDGDRVWYHPYIDGEDSHQSYSTLDAAILGALGQKHDGLNSQFARFAIKMLGMEVQS